MIKRKDSISAIRLGEMTDFVLAPKQALAVIVMIAFIMVCVLAPFGAAHAIVGLSTAAVTILIAGLAAIGITFASTGGFETLEDYVSSLLQDYASDQNIPVTSIFNGIQYSSNAAGKLIINNRFVQLISSFANWVKIKYNLSDNDSVSIVTPSTTFGDLTVANLPYSFTSSYGEEMIYTVISGSGYAILQYSGTNTFSVVVISPVENTAEYHYIYSGRTTITQYRVNTITNSGFYRSGNVGNSFDTQFATLPIYTQSEINDALNNDNVIDINNIGVGIKTGSITLPSDNADYNNGDGAIVDVGARWGESTGGAIATVPEIWPEWLTGSQDVTSDPDVSIDYEAEDVLEDALPQPSDIENLPGATIPGLPDIDGEPWHFEFSNLWHYVAQWVSDMSAGGAVIWNTCIQAPPAILNFVFAGIVLAMWFGAIKILR